MAISALLRPVLDALFPLYCVGCEKEGQRICANCRALIIASPVFCCTGCGKVLDKKTNHAGCERGVLGGIVAAYAYGNPLVRSLLKEYKYQSATDLESTIMGLTSSAVALMQTMIGTPVQIVPVPLHRSRELDRGFNQAERIAVALSGAVGGKVISPLKRTRKTEKQSELSNEERLENCVGAFTSESVSGDILLVDDVVTTAATLNEAAKVLKKAGAKKVTAFVFAHG